ncbi:MAG: YlmC/YmxH family sporulation protein [Eubacteriales bacterium]
MACVCSITDLRCKEVINICNGCRLGFLSNVFIDTECGKIVSLIVPGPCKWFFFGRAKDIIIPWECIVRFGDDIILVNIENLLPRVEEEVPLKKGRKIFF